MKHILYLLLLFIASGQTLIAQEKQTEPLDIHLLELPFPLGPEWYQAQKDAWQAEVKKNKKSENAWENYWFASYGESFWEQDTIRKKELQKEQRTIIKKMKKHIPNTRTYYRHLINQTPDKEQQAVIQQKIISLKRTCERDYIKDLTYCHQSKQTDKIKEICKEWYDSGLFSYDLLFYCYNEFSGLQKGAIFVSDSNAALSYRFLLQYGAGLFSDVLIVDSDELEYPSSQSQFWQKIGMDSEELPDWKRSKDGMSSFMSVDNETTLPKWHKRIMPGAWYLSEKKNRLVYFPQFTSRSGMLQQLKDSLYSEGLVFRYSTKPYNNLAVLRKNYEQNYLLDYLRQPMIHNSSVFFFGLDYLKNYIVTLSPLLRFYDTSGDKNQAIKLRRLLQGILDRQDEEEKVVNTERYKFQKVFKELRRRLLEMKGEGDSSVVVTNLKEQYQKLIDPVEP